MEQIRIAVIVTYDRNPLSLLYIPNSIFGTSPILKIGHPLKTSVGLMQHFTIPTSEKEENIYVWACIHIFNFFFFFYVCLIISPKRFDQPGWFIMHVAGYVFRLVRLKRIFRFGPRKQFFFFLTNILPPILCMFGDFFETAWPIKTIHSFCIS